MRIIDKNHDYYDYLQDPTDNTLVFDRRNSFLLEKSQICEAMYFDFIHRKEDFSFIELQCGATFWIFLVTVTKFGNKEFYASEVPVDYDLELLATWKNYDKPNKLLDINIISTTYLPFNYYDWNWKTRNRKFKKENITPENIRSWFEENPKTKNIGTLRVSTSNKCGWDQKTYTIPLLSATGIANIVPAIDMFCAIEEYFSREKTAAERTEAIGTTNDDKIIMHGFDTKTSFRGKYKRNGDKNK